MQSVKTVWLGSGDWWIRLYFLLQSKYIIPWQAIGKPAAWHVNKPWRIVQSRRESSEVCGDSQAGAGSTPAGNVHS